ncbi:DUF2267 domain-containing protein [Natronococcus wangiae]|uniref:DUF2267 domain-containing protein n=1 Tax=Natronococcus wangiae TaxID=3068275 RepID=UPI00273E2618|nr:DUF2267 domain-containing protein [Natronococcus sp. AD5]
MEHEAFVDTVSDRTDSDTDAAADAARAVLTTLGERLSEDQARDLASQLPGEFSTHLTEGESGQRFSEEEFVSRVDQRMDTVELTGELATTRVMGTLLEAVDESERAAVVDQFEHYGFEELLSETNSDVDVSDRSPRER